MYKPSIYYDYDLFIFTPSVKIHIATAGAEIPWALVNLTKNNFEVYQFYSNIESREFEVNPRLNELVYRRQVELNETFNPEIYLASFVKFASRGFYSFDKTHISNPKDTSYHLVAYPKNQYYEKNNHFVESEVNRIVLQRHQFINPLINETTSLNFESIKLLY